MNDDNQTRLRDQETVFDDVLDDTRADESPRSGMSMDALLRNYEAIIRQMAIYYPVAYQFLGELGRGRQGVVMLGLRQGARGCITEHAIKVFTPALYRSPEEYWTDMGRIASQVTRLQRVQSPNLVSRHSYEETQGIGYLEMENIDGLDLRRFLDRGQYERVRSRCNHREWKRLSSAIFRDENGCLTLQPGVAVYVLRGILRGIASLHEVNFLHADIKPGNIMIDRQGFVRVVDFGRGVVADEPLMYLFGSPGYMAPELHKRQSARKASDLYSVGLVAIELLRGETLIDYASDNESDILRIKEELPGRLDELLPEHVKENEELVEILRRFIQVDPADRHGSARDADVGKEGLRVIDKQLVMAGLDSEYAVDLADYLSKAVNPATQRLELTPLR